MNSAQLCNLFRTPLPPCPSYYKTISHVNFVYPHYQVSDAVMLLSPRNIPSESHHAKLWISRRQGSVAKTRTFSWLQWPIVNLSDSWCPDTKLSQTKVRDRQFQEENLGSLSVGAQLREACGRSLNSALWVWSWVPPMGFSSTCPLRTSSFLGPPSQKKCNPQPKTIPAD